MGKHWLGVLAVIELISPPPEKHVPFYSTRIFWAFFLGDTTSQTLEKPNLAVNQQIAGDLKIPDFFLLKYHSN